MAMVSNTLALRSLQQDDVAWKLLNAQNGAVVIAILDERLGKETGKRTVTDLVNLVDADLEELRERVPGLGMTRSANEYCEQWRRNGYLVRKPVAGSRQETYELSGGALSAISFAKGLAKPHRAATKSRLAAILDRIADLSLATDPDYERRRAVLLSERQRIDKQLTALEQGELEVMDPGQALEHVRDILNMAQEIPRDFVNVSADFERINKSLYAQLIGYEDGYQNTLSDVFAGVDHIAQSPSGQSFRGFYDLLRNLEASEKLQDDIDLILDCDFARELDPEERRFLRRFLQTLLDQSREVNETMTGLARGLRRLVQSRSFQQDRVLKRLLDRALSTAGTLTDLYPSTRALPLKLELTKTPITPISRLELRSPTAASAPPIEDAIVEEARPITLAELHEQVREVEIDFDELTGNVNACLKACAKGESESGVSLAEVLAAHPATQGIASVAGLMILAADQGVRDNTMETVRWQSKSGQTHKARIERFLFIKEVR